MALLGYMGIDQYGNHFKIDKYPRKELLDTLGRKHADNMYVDLKDGGCRHDGYIIADHWISVYQVHTWKNGVNGVE
jgi:hypothetical protein